MANARFVAIEAIRVSSTVVNDGNGIRLALGEPISLFSATKNIMLVNACTKINDGERHNV